MRRQTKPSDNQLPEKMANSEWDSAPATPVLRDIKEVSVTPEQEYAALDEKFTALAVELSKLDDAAILRYVQQVRVRRSAEVAAVLQAAALRIRQIYSK